MADLSWLTLIFMNLFNWNLRIPFWYNFNIRHQLKEKTNTPSNNNGEYEVKHEYYESFIWHCKMYPCNFLRLTIPRKEPLIIVMSSNFGPDKTRKNAFRFELMNEFGPLQRWSEHVTTVLPRCHCITLFILTRTN